MKQRADELGRLYLQEGPAIRSYVARYLRGSHEVDEILQESFLVAARNFDDLIAARSQRAWLIGIARNLIRHRWRKTSSRTMELRDEPQAPMTPEEDPRMTAMREMISKLPDAQRETLQLRLGEELSYAEIAELLKIPIGTVRSRLHQAITTLRKKAGTSAKTTWKSERSNNHG